MTRISPHRTHHKGLFKNRRGYSGIIATIFMVLVVLFLYFNVFTFTMDRNADFQDTTSIVSQMNSERNSEQLSLLDVSYQPSGNRIVVSGTIQNIGPVSAEIVRLWVQVATKNEYGTISENSQLLPSTLQPGDIKYFSGVPVPVNGPVETTDNFTLWFVTARGNTFSVSPLTVPTSITAFIKTFGDFIPDYHSVQWAQLITTSKHIGPWNSGWVIPSSTKAPGLFLVWRVNMTYYGTETMKIANNTMLFFVPYSGKTLSHYTPFCIYIINYTNAGNINSYPNNEYLVKPSLVGTPVTLYFGSSTIGGTDGMSNDFDTYDDRDATGAMMSLTIYGDSPSTYAQSFPLYAISNQGQTFNAALDHFLITAPSSVTAGQSFGSVTVTAYDAWNNVLTNYDGSIYFTSTDPSAVLPYTATSRYTFVAGDAGIHTFSGFRLKTAGSQTLTVTDETTSATSNFITVNPGTSYKLVYVSGGGQSVKKNRYSLGITVQRQDQYGNPTTSGSIIVTLSTSSATGNFYLTTSGNPTPVTSVTISAGSSSATFYYKDSDTGTPTLTASSSGLIQAQTTFTIIP